MMELDRSHSQETIYLTVLPRDVPEETDRLRSATENLSQDREVPVKILTRYLPNTLQM
jgi:hypothetical protein